MKKTLRIILAAVLCAALTLSCFGTAFAAGDSSLPYENSRFFEYGDYTIHDRVFEAEENSSPKGSIFMIHGFALSSYCFAALAERLCAEGYTCVLPDLPGFGYSSRETADTEALPREDIMHALMESLSTERRARSREGHDGLGLLCQDHGMDDADSRPQQASREAALRRGLQRLPVRVFL